MFFAIIHRRKQSMHFLSSCLDGWENGVISTSRNKILKKIDWLPEDVDIRHFFEIKHPFYR